MSGQCLPTQLTLNLSALALAQQFLRDIEGVLIIDVYRAKIIREENRRHLDPEALADGRLILAATKEEATEGAHALVICTEWKRFMAPNFDQLASALRHKLIFDGRNPYDPERLAEQV